MSRPITIGGRTFARGERLPTGLDVPRGALVPPGMVMSYRHGRVRVGLSCAACHSSVDPASGKVLEGVTTLNRGEMPDAANRLRALVDREQRARLVAANAADGPTAAMHVSGDGHPFWVDAGVGFSPDEQAALVAYLLDLTPPAAP